MIRLGNRDMFSKKIRPKTNTRIDKKNYDDENNDLPVARQK